MGTQGNIQMMYRKNNMLETYIILLTNVIPINLIEKIENLL